MESVRKLVANIAATQLPEGLDDGLIFDLNDVRAETIRDGDTYGGVGRLVARLATAREPFHVDVNVGDPIWPAPAEVALPRLLEAAPIRLWGYPREMVLAEKIVTAIQRGQANTRWRDFGDIYQLTRRYAFRASDIGRALQTVAEFRDVELSALGEMLDGYAEIGQPRWAPWRAKLQLTEILPADSCCAGGPASLRRPHPDRSRRRLGNVEPGTENLGACRFRPMRRAELNDLLPARAGRGRCDRTGYRRYGQRQLPRARALAALRDVGVPLEDVAAIVDTTDRGVRRARLVEHRRCLIDAARRAAGRVDAMDRMIEREDAMTSSLRIRAYITGVTKTSLWFNYAAGARNVAGQPAARRASQERAVGGPDPDPDDQVRIA